MFIEFTAKDGEVIFVSAENCIFSDTSCTKSEFLDFDEPFKIHCLGKTYILEEEEYSRTVVSVDTVINGL